MKKIFTLVIVTIVIALTSQAQNTWSQKADFGGTARFFAVSFSIDNKGYIGTGYDGISPDLKKDFWEYDPDLNTWMQKADFEGTIRYRAVGFSIGSKGYLGTGSDINGNNKKDFWEYDPALNTWTQKADFGGAARYLAVGFSIDSKGYLGTGLYYDGISLYYKDFWEYDPALNTWTPKADFGGSGRYGAVGFSLGSKGYLGTGSDDDNLYNDFWEYDPALNTWTQKAAFGGTAREGAVGFSIGSKGYLGTGANYPTSTYYKDFWEFNPDVNTWTQKTDFGGTGRYFAVGFSIGSKGYLGTGTDNVVGYTNGFWEYTPDNSCTTPTATITPLGNLDICETGFVKLQASSGNNYTYQWNRNNVDVPGATNQVFKANKTGNYRVRISSGKGCNAISKKTTVYTSCKLAEEDEFISSLNLFPNPTTGTFTLDLKLDDEENSQAIIQVLNMLGQVVYDETTSVVNGVLEKEIQLNDLAADGMYLVKVIINDSRQNRDGQVFSSQINLQK